MLMVKASALRTFLFFHFYPRVEEGSVITVPVKPQGQNLLDIIKSTFVGAIPVILTGLIFKYYR